MSQLEPFTVGDVPPESEHGKNLEQSLDRSFQRLREILNKGLNFTDNFECHVSTITTNATPGVETAITHGLKRVPVGAFALEKDKAAHIYTGATAKDATTYYVRSDVASVTATIIVF